MSNRNMNVPPSRNWPIPEEKSDDAGLGTVRIHNNVIAVIAHEAADRVPGVVELSGTLVDEIVDIIGKRRDRGGSARSFFSPALAERAEIRLRLE